MLDLNQHYSPPQTECHTWLGESRTLKTYPEHYQVMQYGEIYKWCKRLDSNQQRNLPTKGLTLVSSLTRFYDFISLEDLTSI